MWCGTLAGTDDEPESSSPHRGALIPYVTGLRGWGRTEMDGVGAVAKPVDLRVRTESIKGVPLAG